jgi:hypothetical protein
VMVAGREHARGPADLAVGEPGRIQAGCGGVGEQGQRHDPIMPRAGVIAPGASGSAAGAGLASSAARAWRVQLRARAWRALSATVPAALFAVSETVSAAEALACRSA